LFPDVLQIPNDGESIKVQLSAGFTVSCCKISDPLHPNSFLHLKIKLDAPNLNVVCTVYFAEDFKVLRAKVSIKLPQCGMESYLSSLERCSRWSTFGGKSKRAFYKTHDNLLILKELASGWTIIETSDLLKFSPQYIQYISTTFPTMLSKIFGFYSLKLKSTSKEYSLDLYLMEHLYKNGQIIKKFDLKGYLEIEIRSSKQNM
jgi:hypothetical protein